MVVEQGVCRIVAAEVHERLVNDQTDVTLLTPQGESLHVTLVDEVTRGVVGVDDHQLADVLIGKERHQVIGSIVEVIILWHEGHLLAFVVAIGILLKSRTYKAYLTLRLLHQYLDQFGGTITRYDIGFADPKAFAGNEGVDLHSRRILCQQGVEIGT